MRTLPRISQGGIARERLIAARGAVIDRPWNVE
jgi:hypothetical protein